MYAHSLPPFEALQVNPEPTLWLIYKLLLNHLLSTDLCYLRGWEPELGQTFSAPQKDKIPKLTYTSSYKKSGIMLQLIDPIILYTVPVTLKDI